MGGIEVSSRRSVRVAGASLAAALLLAGCGSEVAGSSGPPLLRIGTGTAEGAVGLAAPSAQARGTATGGSGGSGGEQDPYPLEGTLPSGPSAAAVWRYAATPIPRADVVPLAEALGMVAAPVRHPHGWVVTTTSGSLRVRDGAGLWSFARGSSPCASSTVDVDDPDGVMSGVACAVSGTAVPVPVASGPAGERAGAPAPVPGTPVAGSVTPVPGTQPSGGPASRPGALGPGAPSDAAALAAARPLLGAVGLPPRDARVVTGETGPGMRTVAVDPTVGGLPTSGLRTLVEVDRAGVVAATGVLAAPTRGDEYPIVSASAALDLLRAMPQPEIAMACAIGRACPGLGPRVVTGARLGLTMAYDAGAPVLVPAWLFRIKGSDDAVAVVAVQRRYLADPVMSSDGTTGSTAGSTGGSGSAPGASGGGGTAPSAVPPSAPSLATTPQAHVVTRVTVGADGRTLTLETQGGVCAAYAGSAVETSDTVTVTVSSTPSIGTDLACPAIAKVVDVTVVLASPWDHRRVVDAASGREIVPG